MFFLLFHRFTSTNSDESKEQHHSAVYCTILFLMISAEMSYLLLAPLTQSKDLPSPAKLSRASLAEQSMGPFDRLVLRRRRISQVLYLLQQVTSHGTTDMGKFTIFKLFYRFTSTNSDEISQRGLLQNNLLLNYRFTSTNSDESKDQHHSAVYCRKGDENTPRT
mgnify:CR=1 FL=1